MVKIEKTYNSATKQPSVVTRAGRLIVDLVLFVLLLALTAVIVIAVSIAAPMAVGITAIVGRDRGAPQVAGLRTSYRAGWTPAKAL